MPLGGRQPDLFMSLKRDIAMVSIVSSALQFIQYIFFVLSSCCFMQVTQQVFVVEECVRSAHNKFEAKYNFRREVEKMLGFIKKEKSQLAEKLKTSEHDL